jgi:pimeloyl-ACP methyl ester carboxylesterase
MSFRRPEDFEHKNVQLSEVNVHYVREGSGPPLLLLHGWPGFWWDWRYVIEPLSEHFDVIVPDFRGSGDSDKPDLDDIAEYTMTKIADDQAEFLDALGVSEAFVLAHDFGSIVAHKFLRKYADRVTKAVILDPVTPGGYTATGGAGTYRDVDWFAIYHQFDFALDIVSLNRDSRRIHYRYFMDEWSHRKPLLSDEEFEILIDNYMKPGNVHGGFNYDRANLARTSKLWDVRDYNRSDIDVTVLWGASDIAVPSSGAAYLPQFYSNYSLEMIEECGHFVMLEKPDVVIDRVKQAFL